MFVTIGEDKDRAVQRAFAFGVDLVNPADAEWDTTQEALELYPDPEVTGAANLTTGLAVGVRRNALMVLVNPKLGEAVGYQPAAPQALFAPHYGAVDVCFRSEEDAQLALDHLGEDWLVRLCMVSVGLPGR